MYLSRINIQNFRILKTIDIPFHQGLNILFGENDSGKTTIVDAIRLILGTRDYERLQITPDDFYVDKNGRANQLSIEVTFDDLLEDEAPLFLEWIGINGNKPDGMPNYFLDIRLTAIRKESDEILNKYDREVSWEISAGPGKSGTLLAQNARDLLRATYLRPLRDAEQELAARKGSRLSQILFAHPDIRNQDEKSKGSIPNIVSEANQQVRNHPVIKKQVKTLNEDYLSNFTLGYTPISASVDIAKPSLRWILERLELSLTDDMSNTDTKHGLGLNNLLFMATELLLLRSVNTPALPLGIIEEPEAHLHPQYQLRLMTFLKNQTLQAGERQVQIIMTSHSPSLATKVPLENIILLRNGITYPLGPEYTNLDKSDYVFLETFLDATKADLFFARGILIVEGDAERILLPSIAKLMGKPLDKFGITIINVGHVGLFRYARIFQRKDSTIMDIKVACITDLDIPASAAKPYLKASRKTSDEFTPEEISSLREKKISRASGGSVVTYVSPNWTLEYDLCMHSTLIASFVHQAIKLSSNADGNSQRLTSEGEEQIRAQAQQEFNEWQQQCKSEEEISSLIYEPLYKKQASKVETAHYLSALLTKNLVARTPAEIREMLPKYLVDAIEYVTAES